MTVATTKPKYATHTPMSRRRRHGPRSEGGRTPKSARRHFNAGAVVRDPWADVPDPSKVEERLGASARVARLRLNSFGPNGRGSGQTLEPILRLGCGQ